MTRPGLLRFSRFGLSSVFATMLLCISVAGWWRYERLIDAKEQAAIEAMTAEGIGLRITRRSESLRAGNSSFDPANEEPPGILQRAWDQAFGTRDPIVTLMAEQIPSDETQRKLLDVPQLERLWIFGNVQPNPGETYPEPPTLEQMLGRPLPDLPPTVSVPDEPPPLPRGTPLNQAERKQVLEEIASAWRKQAKLSMDNTLFYVSSDDADEQQTVCIRHGKSRLRIERCAEPREFGYPSRVWSAGRAFEVQRRWDTGQWRLEYAGRTFDESQPAALQEVFGIADKGNLLGELLGGDFMMDFAFQDDNFEMEVFGRVFEEVERLSDSGFILRRAPGLAAAKSFAGDLEEGWIVVGPAPSYRVRRLDDTIDSVFHAGSASRTDIFEYETIDGTTRPCRRATWIQERGSEVPESATKHLTRYAWEFDPDLPPDFFSPSRGGNFFTSQPPAFRWWYFTGAFAVLAYLAIGIANLRKRCAGRGSPDPAPVDAAEVS